MKTYLLVTGTPHSSLENLLSQLNDTDAPQLVSFSRGVVSNNPLLDTYRCNLHYILLHASRVD